MLETIPNDQDNEQDQAENDLEASLNGSNGKVKPAPDKRAGFSLEALKEWQAAILADAEHPIVRQLVVEYPKWLMETFDTQQAIDLDLYSPRGLRIWVDNHDYQHCWFNKKQSVYIGIYSFTEEELTYLATHLSSPGSLKPAKATDSGKIPYYRFWLKSPGDIRVLKELTLMAFKRLSGDKELHLTTLKQTFARFRQDPMEQLRVKVRHIRAEQLRQLLSQPEKVTLDTFNKEVWQFESGTYLQGKKLNWSFYEKEPFSEELLRQINDGLDNGEFVLHGNYIWGSATRVFGSTLAGQDPDESKRTQLVHQALTILNQSNLTPMEKAEQILKIKGFGPNITTGLVMVYHPAEFGLYNTPSKDALVHLGYPVDTLPQFEKGAARLKQILGATDFIELDRFLYLTVHGWSEDKDSRVEGKDEDKEDDEGYEEEENQTLPFEQWFANLNTTQEEEKSFLKEYIDWVSRTFGSRVDFSFLKYQNFSLFVNGKLLIRGYLNTGKGIYINIRLKNLPQEQVTYLSQNISQPDTVQPTNWKGAEGYRFIVYTSSDLAALERVTQQTVEAILNLDAVGIQSYIEPSFGEIKEHFKKTGFRISERTLRRYHLALKTRGFVILSGLSGTGKTWLTRVYAEAVGAKYKLVPVAPNWTSNEDLLGYFNPVSQKYYHSAFSQFLYEAYDEFQLAKVENRNPWPYHLVLDEMNLARVEYYFAKLLSAMEVRAQAKEAEVELEPGKPVTLPPNFYFIGTVNVDETTHGFADKVYDRAQLIELEAPRKELEEHLGPCEYQEILMKVWDAVHEVGPFAFRVLDEIKSYVEEAKLLGVPWKEALDEQLLQKILPKLKGADPRIGQALVKLKDLTEQDFKLSFAKASYMYDGFSRHEIASYF